VPNPLPAPLHRALLRVAHRLRLVWWRLVGAELHGCNVVVVNSAGEILLVRHSYQTSDRWMLPGGGLAPGEPPEAAAKREIREETGCRIDSPRHFATDVETFAGCRNHVHLVAATTVDRPRADRREIIEARFFPPDGLPAMISRAAQARVERWRRWREEV
jgi:8-oxo-dGTP pyrophosphatase MutT (NUDIX family)